MNKRPIKRYIFILLSICILLSGCASKAISLNKSENYDNYVVGEFNGDFVNLEGEIIGIARIEGIDYYSIAYTNMEEMTVFQTFTISDYGADFKMDNYKEGDYIKISNAKVNDTWYGEKIDSDGNLKKSERDILINNKKCKIGLLNE